MCVRALARARACVGGCEYVHVYLENAGDPSPLGYSRYQSEAVCSDSAIGSSLQAGSAADR